MAEPQPRTSIELDEQRRRLDKLGVDFRAQVEAASRAGVEGEARLVAEIRGGRLTENSHIDGPRAYPLRE